MLVALLLPRLSHAAPTPAKVLLVADGLSPQEDDLENHFIDLGWSLTRIKDYKVNGTTKFSGYDLIVLTETAPLVPSCGLTALKASGKPVLVFETWSFLYAYRLGLTTTALPTLADDDTVTAVREGYDDFTSRVGAEALVYQPHASVFGVSASRVKAGVTQIFQSGGCLPGATVLADYTKKIAVTGVTDTSKYTVDAWKMLDILTAQILPPPPRYGSLDEVAQAYVDSGLYDLLRDVESDLKQQPGSWTFAEAEQEAWLLTSEWHLDELRDYVTDRLGEAFGEKSRLPDFHVSYGHPERPHGTGVSYLSASDTDEVEHWFLGQYWDPTNNNAVVQDAYWWSEYHGGTDLGLGMNVKLNGRYWYYMGDTSKPVSGNGMWSTNNCDYTIGVQCNDMIVTSNDEDPSDGIDVSPILEKDVIQNALRWKPIVIPGVHNDFSPQLQPLSGRDFWIPPSPPPASPVGGPAYTVPTGAVATTLPFAVVEQGSQLVLELNVPMVVLWYGTATAPGGDYGYEALDSSNPRTRPASWVGCSFDGKTFYACYRSATGEVVPFSVDEAPPVPSTPGGPSSDPGKPARFIQIAAVNVTASDFEGMCANDPPVDTGMCDLYEDGATYWYNSGLLLYGSGRPNRKSGLFLAFIRTTELGKVDSTGKPIVHYWSNHGWSLDEEDAVSLTGDPPPCDDWRRPDYDRASLTKSGGCWPTDNVATTPDWEQVRVFGELSARLIRSNDPNTESQIVLLNNNAGAVLSWKAPLSAPWGYDFDHLAPSLTKTKGYGPYIIDAYSDSEYTGNPITLWHTISVWDGTTNTPYGVYTGSEVISWP